MCLGRGFEGHGTEDQYGAGGRLFLTGHGIFSQRGRGRKGLPEGEDSPLHVPDIRDGGKRRPCESGLIPGQLFVEVCPGKHCVLGDEVAGFHGQHFVVIARRDAVGGTLPGEIFLRDGAPALMSRAATRERRALALAGSSEG